MRKYLLIILTFIYTEAFSQILVQGNVKDSQGQTLPGAIIIEEGTENKTTTDLEGNFALKTIQDSCTINFFFFGLESKTVTLTKDSTLNITLEFGDYYNTRWLTIGTNYDFFNNVYGLELSNGTHEAPLIHFEDFQDKLLIKINGQSNFKNNYSYVAEVGWLYLPIRYLTQLSLAYSVHHFKSTNLFLKDLNLSSKIGYFRNSLILIKTGYQELHGRHNWGLSLGFEREFKNLYYGYYFDYFIHNAYLQIGFDGKGLLSFRTTYNRINTYNLLTLGVHYSFVRNNNR